MIVEIKSINRTIDFTVPDDRKLVTSEFYNNKMEEAIEICELVNEKWDENSNGYLEPSELLFLVGLWQFIAQCHHIIAIKNNLIMPEIIFDDFFTNANTIDGFSWRFPLKTGEFVAEDALGNSHVYIRVVCESSPYLNDIYNPESPIASSDEYRYYMEQNIPLRDTHIIASAFPFGSAAFGVPALDLLNAVFDRYPVVDCYGNCTGGCSSGCQDSCIGICSGTCNDTCTGNCSGGCWTVCSSGCGDECDYLCALHCSSNNCSSECWNVCHEGCGKTGTAMG